MRVKIRESANKYLLSILCVEAFRLPGSIKDRLPGLAMYKKSMRPSVGKFSSLRPTFHQPESWKLYLGQACSPRVSWPTTKISFLPVGGQLAKGLSFVSTSLLCSLLPQSMWQVWLQSLTSSRLDPGKEFGSHLTINFRLSCFCLLLCNLVSPSLTRLLVTEKSSEPSLPNNNPMYEPNIWRRAHSTLHHSPVLTFSASPSFVIYCLWLHVGPVCHQVPCQWLVGVGEQSAFLSWAPQQTFGEGGQRIGIFSPLMPRLQIPTMLLTSSARLLVPSSKAWSYRALLCPQEASCARALVCFTSYVFLHSGPLFTTCSQKQPAKPCPEFLPRAPFSIRLGHRTMGLAPGLKCDIVSKCSSQRMCTFSPFFSTKTTLMQSSPRRPSQA